MLMKLQILSDDEWTLLHEVKSSVLNGTFKAEFVPPLVSEYASLRAIEISYHVDYANEINEALEDAENEGREKYIGTEILRWD
jgi:hypothetical protein